MKRSLLGSGGLGLACLVVGLPAYAQETSAARAQALFDRGLAAAREGNLAKACPLFRASEDAEARTGTLFNLATCYEKNWQTASAWAAYREAEALAVRESRPDLQEQARQKWKVLEPRLVRLTIHVPPASRLPGLVVTRDGAPLTAAEYDVALPVDPGEHTVTAKAQGRAPWEQKVTLTKESRDTQVPVLELPKKASWWTTGRKVGLGMAAAGVATFAVGGIVALVGKSKYDDAADSCSDQVNHTGCRPGASADKDSATKLANGGGVAMIVGGVLGLGGGALLWLADTKPKRGYFAQSGEKGLTSVSVGAGSVSFAGRF